MRGPISYQEPSTVSGEAQWTQISGPTAVLASPTSISTTAIIPSDGGDVGAYTFQITVSDGEYSDSATVSFTVDGG
jgi:hypothetical protein